jgi:hypothetical protein
MTKEDRLEGGRTPLSTEERLARLFWDVDKRTVDFKRHRSYVIRRIMDYGDLEDVKWMLAAYSDRELIDVLKRSRGLSRKSATFWAVYFGIPKEEIECLKKSCPKRLRPF